eukprot:SAG31_NODE_686_length_12815_cov_5.367175_9_plen_130_part_00
MHGNEETRALIAVGTVIAAGAAAAVCCRGNDASAASQQEPAKPAYAPTGTARIWHQMMQKREGLVKLFELIDDDSSGQITVEELGRGLRMLKIDVSDAQLQELMKKMDADGQGTLNPCPYTKFMYQVLS